LKWWIQCLFCFCFPWPFSAKLYFWAHLKSYSILQNEVLSNSRIRS
jgi:hypothetical protein